jgi:hypothetical protein
MVRAALLLAFFLFSAFSCSKEEEVFSDPLERFPAPIVQVDAPATAVVNEITPIEVHFVVNNGCGYFGRFETKGTGYEQEIRVYPKYRPNICHQALVTLKETYEFEPTTKGTYTLRFYYLPDKPEEYITKTIVVGDVASIGQK